VEILVAFIALVLLDIAAWRWGVDSRQWGLEPRATGRPERWI
jgi:hypothetical protein